MEAGIGIAKRDRENKLLELVAIAAEYQHKPTAPRQQIIKRI